ncbi:cysteine synthase A [Actinobacillus delphinicola]|uniref:cysteine synthase A n=1 Tax=Actinobacillus delphinicola TaxID=51161 RepID=UPI002442AA29|nr:cysteine synthase A [Actinobacillus delphinicola]MDG6897482.1 cysteine synthase A [Actinobacillus delphinicola]
MIYSDNTESIGKTPLIRLQHFGQHNILAKVESRNPSFSVKCRVGANMIWQAEKDGILVKGKEVLEATSGNTGVALAYATAARGYALTIVMPENMSEERKLLLKGLGVNLILTEASLGMKGAMQKAKEIYETDPSHYVMLNQFENPANPDIHRRTTGPEIIKDTDGKIDVIVAGVGTGGTLTGIATYMKKDLKKDVIVVAVEPSESPVITQKLAGKDLNPAPHKIQGIGAGFIPKNLDLSLIDRVICVTSEEALATARDLMKKEGILAGISSGAAVFAANKLAQDPYFKDKNIVAILPSSAERYLSTVLFDPYR